MPVSHSTASAAGASQSTADPPAGAGRTAASEPFSVPSRSTRRTGTRCHEKVRWGHCGHHLNPHPRKRAAPRSSPDCRRRSDRDGMTMPHDNGQVHHTHHRAALASHSRHDTHVSARSAAARDMTQLLDAVGDAEAVAAPGRDGVRIDVHRLGVVRGKHTVLHAVDLRIEPGELVGIVGSSGAGKSSLLDAIAGIRPPTSGTVSFDGIPRPRPASSSVTSRRTTSSTGTSRSPRPSVTPPGCACRPAPQPGRSTGSWVRHSGSSTSSTKHPCVSATSAAASASERASASSCSHGPPPSSSTSRRPDSTPPTQPT